MLAHDIATGSLKTAVEPLAAVHLTVGAQPGLIPSLDTAIRIANNSLSAVVTLLGQVFVV